MLTCTFWLVLNFMEVQRAQGRPGTRRQVWRALAVKLADGAPADEAARIKAEASAARFTIGKTWRGADFYIAGRHGVGGGDWIAGRCWDAIRYPGGQP